MSRLVSLACPLEELTQALTSPQGRFLGVRRFAVDLITSHGLAGWKFRFNKRKTAMGLCVYQRQTIELSAYFVSRNPTEEILDTLLHEIAHALVGPEHGHDEVWKQKCIAIGARPLRCGDAKMPEGSWQASCRQCGKSYHRHRKPKRMQGWFCRKCGPERGGLVWKSIRTDR